MMTVVEILCAEDCEVTRKGRAVATDAIIEKESVLRIYCVILINIWTSPSAELSHEIGRKRRKVLEVKR
jgi:hypothetical protein